MNSPKVVEVFMFLQYSSADGKRHEVLLSGRASLTFGRSPEADVNIPETRISRIHAEIRSWDQDFVIKDMHSRNGITLNGIRTEVAILKTGDVIRIGTHEFTIEQEATKGTRTIVREVAQEIEEGKGYRTILREIVQSTDTRKKNPESRIQKSE
jgi:pSer/pThr/pTyr-binding forkhead associated (FHA) protein